MSRGVSCTPHIPEKNSTVHRVSKATMQHFSIFKKRNHSFPENVTFMHMLGYALCMRFRAVTLQKIKYSILFVLQFML